jgi:hypothetical protein
VAQLIAIEKRIAVLQVIVEKALDILHIGTGAGAPDGEGAHAADEAVGYATSDSAARAASTVRVMSSSVCAPLRNAASNCEGGQ